MKLVALSIRGFRSIKEAEIKLGSHDVLVGPNGVGKSTIIDALSLVFGRTRLVRELTEHDFHGSSPEATSRIRIVATLTGFDSDDPDRNDTWFREGRAVPKWWNTATANVEPERTDDAATLCAQIAFAARFDLDELVVETLRYFHDDDEVEDPFQDDAVQQVPNRLFDDIGYFVLPARRTWEAAASFASELFRKTVATVGGIPAQTVLDERDRLRRPADPLEETPGLKPLADRINEQLKQLIPASPSFQLRITATDSESLLRALVPHYLSDTGIGLPVGRHGMGLLSMQTFILLLELGRERIRQGKPFLFAMEEPELHLPPGIQRRLVAQAVAIAEQTVCTSHSPRVAAYFPATHVQVLNRRPDRLVVTPLLAQPLGGDASNAMRKLYQDARPRVIEALMHHRVCVPEGRSEYEWFRLLSEALETGELALSDTTSDTPSFGTVVGVVPTHDGAVAETYRALRALRPDLVPLVDGDDAGDAKVQELRALNPSPDLVLQWRPGWTVEDAIGWVLKGAEEEARQALQERLDHEFATIDELVAQLKIRTGPSRLKTDYLAYEQVASVIGGLPGCRERAARLLDAITAVCIDRIDEADLVAIEGDPGDGTTLMRLQP